MPGIGIEGLAGDLDAQLRYIADRPSYVRMMSIALPLLDGWLGEQLAQRWSGRAFTAGYERPLLLLAALRYDALCVGPEHGLHRALVTRPAQLDAITERALREAFASPRVQRALEQRSIQTNETTRAVSWLWPAQLLDQAGAREPLALVDLGTSAGLNLIADALPASWVDQHGTAVAVEPRPPVALRLGLDRAPIDLRVADDAQWLRACVWQDDVERLERLERGFSVFLAAAERGDGPELRRVPLEDIAAPLAELPQGPRVLLLQTVVRDYLPPPERERYVQAIEGFLDARPALGALWMQLELRDRDLPVDRSMTLSACFRDARGVRRELVLARTHPHPRVLHVEPAAVAELQDCVRAARA